MRKILLIVLAVAGLVGVRWQVRKELGVLYGFENAAQLRQTLKADAYCARDFAQDGTNYVGIMLWPTEYPAVLRHTQFFHQAAPVYIFERDGKKVDFTRNHNDDHAFFHRWTEMFPNAMRCGCGWRRPSR